MTRKALLTLALCTGAVWCTVVPARAQAPGDSVVSDTTEHELDQQAHLHFKRGKSLFEAGDYEQALTQFERAYELSQRPELLFNLTIASERLGRFETAAQYLRAYLDSGLQIRNRGLLEMRHTRLLERAAEQRRRDQEVQVSPPRPQPEIATPSSTAPPPPPRHLTSTSRAMLVVAGVGAAGAVVLGPLALRERRSVADRCERPCSKAETRKALGLSVATDVSLGLAVAGGLAAGVLWWMSDRGDAKERPTEHAVLSPWVTRRGAGASAGWVF